MKKFIIEEEFWNLFPDAKIGVIVCHGIDNKIKKTDRYKEIISEAEKKALDHIQNPDFSKNTVIKSWRDAFKKFKTKKGARSSIEALLKRVSNENHINTINPLVDIYNSVSLKYAFPCGGEDMDTFSGDIRLTRAVGDEDFVTLGSDKVSPPYQGEIIYKDDKGAICRCWNWRESVRTMLTENTTNAFLCLELIDEDRFEEFKEGLKYLGNTIQENLGGDLTIEILDINHYEIKID